MFVRLLTACLLAICIGCGKQPASSPSPAELKTDTAVPTAKPSAAAPQVDPSAAAAAEEAQIAAALNELTQAVRRYSVEQRRVPKTLDELVARGYLSRVPQAPGGKTFAINKDLQVYLANR